MSKNSFDVSPASSVVDGSGSESQRRPHGMTSDVEQQVLQRREKILEVCARHQTVAGSAASNTHDRILRAAIPMFATVGYEACTMRAIGLAVNVKGPALYNHFKSKENIFFEAIWLLLGEFFVEVLEPLVHEPPDD